ncbi:MAG: hypothetical protein KF699_01270 [Phycisphaeraceae bacterium]|nr:hypothetical protein [Phycisphaeraceae bacterium]
MYKSHGVGFALVVALLSSLSVLPTALAQCLGCPDGARVDDLYVASPTTGKYRLVYNKLGTHHNFAVMDDANQRHTVPMADPTIMYLNGWYYVTGTSPAARDANFAIYRSTDLVTWEPHMLAFSESGSQRKKLTGTDKFNPSSYTPSPLDQKQMLHGPFCDGCSSDVYALTIGAGDEGNSALFRDLWAPHLFLDPNDCTAIYLSFTSRKVVNPKVCTYPLVRTVYYAKMSISAFEARTANFAAGGGQPWTYNYRIGQTPHADGGLTAGFPIPCSANLEEEMDPCNPAGQPGFQIRIWMDGEAEFWGPNINVQGRNLMALDTFHYFDPAASNKRWMFYTWVSDRAGWNGNHIAAHPMLNARNMDASASNLSIGVAYRYNTSSNRIEVPSDSICTSLGCSDGTYGCMWNGIGGPDGGPLRPVPCDGTNDPITELPYEFAGAYGAAEAPAAFFRSGKTYLLFSRNNTDGPAYGIFYRFAAKPVSNMGIGFNDTTTPELPMVRSINRATAGGRSYGHGEVFMGPTVYQAEAGQRYFVIFHAKRQTGEVGVPYRTVFIKELRFLSNGTIRDVIENNSTVSRSDVEAFLVPWDNPVPPPAVCGESQQLATGSGGFSDVAAFLSAWFAGSELADVDGDGAIDQGDLMRFIGQHLDLVSFSDTDSPTSN